MSFLLYRAVVPNRISGAQHSMASDVYITLNSSNL